MKLRTDFVSNSSSSSFIINGFEDAINLLIKHFGNEYISYRFSESIRFTVVCKERDAEELERYFTDTEYEYQPYSMWDVDKKHKINLDDEHYIYDVHIERMLNCTDKCILSKLQRVTISTTEDNDEIGKLVLKLLFRFFKKNGIDVDASQTEVDFIESDDIISKLTDLA